MISVASQNAMKGGGIARDARDNLLGVSVHYLQTIFLQEVEDAGFTRDLECSEFEDIRGPPGVIRQKGLNVECPVDGLMGAAYVHCISGEDNVGVANFSISCPNSTSIGDVVDSLSDFCSSQGHNPKRAYVWAVVLSRNQHRCKGVVYDETDLHEYAAHCHKEAGHLLALMSPWEDPTFLRRTWCIFELITAYKNEVDISYIMPAREKDSLMKEFVKEGDEVVQSKIFNVLARTMSQNANASFEKDREHFLRVIETEFEGGFAKCNALVNDGLRVWINRVKHEMIRADYARPQEAKTIDKDLLGVSVHHITTEFTRMVINGGLGRDATIYDIEDLSGQPGLIRKKGLNVECPLDGRKGAAYVHCISGGDNVGVANFMLSYTWGYTIGDIADTLLDYCHTNSLNPKRTYVWLCCLCVNEHRIVEEERNGQVDLFTEFSKRVMGVRHVLSMMTPWHAPANLKRVWCIFEIFLAHSQDCKIEIVMPPEEKTVLKFALFHDTLNGINLIHDTFSGTSIVKAKASREADRIAILDLVGQKVGHAELDSRINDLIRSLVNSVIHSMIQAWFNAYRRADRGKLSHARECEKVAKILLRLEEHEEALSVYQKCLEIRLHLLGEEDPETARVQRSIGFVRDKMGNHIQALAIYRQCLPFYKSYFGTNHPETGNLIECMGTAFNNCGESDKALLAYRECLAIRVCEYHPNHPEVAKIRACIAAVLERLPDLPGALNEYQRALEIYELTLGEFNVNTGRVLCKLGNVFRKQGNFVEGNKKLDTGVAVLQKILGKEHPEAVQAQSQATAAMAGDGRIR